MSFTVSYEIELESDISLDFETAQNNFETWEEYASFIFSEHFPCFYFKYKNDIKFEQDESLDNGLEFSMWTWIDGIESAFEFLDDFFEEFKEQDNFYFDHTTGFHINLSKGTKKQEEFNLIKGILFLNEEHALRTYAHRDNCFHAQRIKDKFIEKVVEDFSFLDDQYFESIMLKKIKHNRDYVENYLLKILHKIMRKLNDNIGFNISKIEEGYVEFRYPGGIVSKEQIKSSTLYYSMLVDLMLDEELSKRKYLKRLTSLIINSFSNSRDKRIEL